MKLSSLFPSQEVDVGSWGVSFQDDRLDATVSAKPSPNIAHPWDCS